MLAHCDHPLTQALVGVDMFSRVYGDVFANIPLGGQFDNPDAVIYQGVAQINAAQLVLRTLALNDPSGDTEEWTQTSTAEYETYIANGTKPNEMTPLVDSIIAESYAYEPVTESFIKRCFIINGIVGDARKKRHDN